MVVRLLVKGQHEAEVMGIGISQVKMPQGSLFYGKNLVFLNKHFSDYWKPLFRFRSSAEVNFDRFCQVLCFMEEHVFHDLY